MLKLVLVLTFVAFVAADAANFYKDGKYQPFATQSNRNNQYNRYNKYQQYNQNNKYNQYSQQYPQNSQYQVTRPVTPVAPVTPLAPAAPVTPPLSYSAERAAAILRSDLNINPDGSYEYSYETENGIAAQQQGQQRRIGTESSNVAQGSFRFRTPEGIPVEITYTADENGYQPASDILPTPPPVPAAILRAIEWNAAHPGEQ